MISSLRLRRTFTLVGALAALLLGLAAIQAAAAWTADAAPLAATPVSATSIESKLATEQARSADLQSQLLDISMNAERLSAALEAAQARIDADASHAKDLERDLKAARKKLTALQRSIKAAAAANAANAARATAAARATTAPATGTGGGDDDEHEGGG